MNVEEEIKKCEVYLKQIKQYDPDPFYVDYFFNKYIHQHMIILYPYLDF